MKPKAKSKERFVLICTEYRGVFAGLVTDTSGETVKMRQGRNCIYWPASVKGFEGLAVTGPLDGSRVGPAADIELRNVTCIVECTPEARERWEKGPWA